MTKKILSFIFSCLMLASSAVFTANAADGAPEYQIKYIHEDESGKVTAEIYISGGIYGVGRFGLTYDAQNLDLLNKDGELYNADEDNIADVVIGAVVEDQYSIIATEETNYASELINTEDGNIFFAWYANHRIVDGKDKGYVNSNGEPKIIATINFVNADGTDSEDIAGSDGLFGEATEGPADAEGWEDINSAGGGIGNNYGSGSFGGVSGESDYVPVVQDFTVSAGASGTTATINLQLTEDDENISIAKFKLEIYDENGTLLEGATKEVASSAKSVKFTSADGLVRNKNYTVKVTPYTKSGFAGTPKSDTFKTSSSSPSGSPTGGATGGAVTYTVTYVAGDGTIPEGQKFKYEVQRNGYVSGSPAVLAPEGKVFAGWSVDGVTLISVEVYKITKDVTFKAIYVDSEAETHRPFIVGYPGGEVRADNSLTRAEAATIIARCSGKFEENREYAVNYFSDVTEGHWAYKYISFVYENNIVTGYENGTFAPDNKITRAEFATIMQRYLGLELHEESTFVDVDKDNWAVAYIGACKFAGLINGYENGEFRPSNEITRAEAVKILNRASDRAPTPNAIDAYVDEKGIPFEDLKENKWYFYEIMEAAFPHLISYYH